MSGTFFGDYEVEDEWDTARPDPEQVARRLHLIRQRVERLAAGRDFDDYDDLPADDVNDYLFVGEQIVAWVITNPADGYTNGDLAQEMHEISRTRHRHGEPWDRLSDDERDLALAIGDLIGDWLRRQGGWR
jgi:hypothetical protein